MAMPRRSRFTFAVLSGTRCRREDAVAEERAATSTSPSA